MRVNIYAEELGDKVEIANENTEDGEFTGVRFNIGDEGSFGRAGKVRSTNAVTLWGKGTGEQLIPLFERALSELKAQAQASGQPARQPAHA